MLDYNFNARVHGCSLLATFAIVMVNLAAGRDLAGAEEWTRTIIWDRDISRDTKLILEYFNPRDGPRKKGELVNPCFNLSVRKEGASAIDLLTLPSDNSSLTGLPVRHYRFDVLDTKMIGDELVVVYNYDTQVSNADYCHAVAFRVDWSMGKRTERPTGISPTVTRADSVGPLAAGAHVEALADGNPAIWVRDTFTSDRRFVLRPHEVVTEKGVEKSFHWDCDMLIISPTK